jgi:hypothetical protein
VWSVCGPTCRMRNCYAQVWAAPTSCRCNNGQLVCAQRVTQQLCWGAFERQQALQLQYYQSDPCLLSCTKRQRAEDFDLQAATYTCCSAHTASPVQQRTASAAGLTSGNEERGDFQRSTCCPRATMRSSSDGLGSSCSTQPVSHMLYASSYGSC